ncbi:MAG TPA: glycosyltransferase family 2 protein [Blastococcus sp.]|nr:glycosyltransferase family 2 protein [Blastococcus sp.]
MVVPLYNEATVIADVVRGIREAFPNVVCVDDGSTDGSAVAARRGGAVVVQHPVNLGQGAALQTGISYALRDPEMKYIVTFDADGQHQVSDAVAMVEELHKGAADVVFGSRFLDSRTKPSRAKRALLRAAVVYTNLTTKMRLTDAHNGLRAMNRSVAERLDIRQNRMAHASEIVEQIGTGGFRYAEHPVHIIYTDYSRSKGQSMLNSVNIVTEMFFQ